MTIDQYLELAKSHRSLRMIRNTMMGAAILAFFGAVIVGVMYGSVGCLGFCIATIAFLIFSGWCGMATGDLEAILKKARQNQRLQNDLNLRHELEALQHRQKEILAMLETPEQVAAMKVEFAKSAKALAADRAALDEDMDLRGIEDAVPSREKA